jgi:hypothetical protein
VRVQLHKEEAPHICIWEVVRLAFSVEGTRRRIEDAMKVLIWEEFIDGSSE